jgi:hypothetical protein
MTAPAVTFREYAAICAGIYNAGATSVAGFTRHSPLDQRLSGFQGAVYRRATGGSFDWIVAIAGTQPTDTGGADVIADAGFGGPAPGLLHPVLAVVAAAGSALLWHQVSCAEDMVRGAQAAMGGQGRLTITGHSLGGGISQIVSARMGIPAVGISAPAVTAVPTVRSSWTRTRSPITCLRVRNDPINATGMMGDLLGRVVPLDSPRTGGAAHSIAGTLAELEPAGSFSGLGARDPFAA